MTVHIILQAKLQEKTKALKDTGEQVKQTADEAAKIEPELLAARSNQNEKKKSLKTANVSCFWFEITSFVKKHLHVSTFITILTISQCSEIYPMDASFTEYTTCICVCTFTIDHHCAILMNWVGTCELFSKALIIYLFFL